MSKKNYKADKWWASCGFDDMEKVSGFRQDDFSPEDGYQEFVDACDKWWDALSASSKQTLYDTFNT